MPARCAIRAFAPLSLIAPHFVVEEMTVAAIERAREAYAAGDLRRKLVRWHADVDVAFRGWNDAWLDPKFREWDITRVSARDRRAGADHPGRG